MSSKRQPKKSMNFVRLRDTNSKKTTKRKNTHDSTENAPKTKRTRIRTNRYGNRLSGIDRDEFFTNIENSMPSIENLNELNDDSHATHTSENGSNSDYNCEDESPGSNTSTSSESRDCGRTDQSDLVSLVPEQSPITISTFESPMSPSSSISPSSINASNHSFQKVVLEKLDELLIRISSVEKNVAKAEIRLKDLENLQTTDCNINIGRIDFSELAQYGLPKKNKENLDEFEKRLKSKEFKSKMVN